MSDNDEVWTLTICLVPESYPDEKHPKDIDTHVLDYVPKGSDPGVALDGLIEQARKDTDVNSLENDHVAWMQLSYHEDDHMFNEENPDWSYSYKFQRRTKVWRVKEFEDALDGFRTMVMREADGPA